MRCYWQFTAPQYLRSVRPLMDDENYTRMQGLAKDFEKGIGKKLQRWVVEVLWFGLPLCGEKFMHANILSAAIVY